MIEIPIQAYIQTIIDKRSAILKTNYESEEADRLRQLIRDLLFNHQEELTVEFILESLTRLGAAPSLLYDDDGHWTVGGDGMQAVMAFEDRSKETTFDASWWVGPGRWKQTIREALRDYLVPESEEIK